MLWRRSGFSGREWFRNNLGHLSHASSYDITHLSFLVDVVERAKPSHVVTLCVPLSYIDNDRFNHPRSSDVNVKPSNSLSMHIAISNTLTCSVIRHPSGMLEIKSPKNMKRNLSPLAAHWRLHSICPSPFLGSVDHPCPP
jgi:hypothetical protein